MRRYWIHDSTFKDNEILIQGDLFHHIFDVCRQDVGSKFEVISPDSKAYFVEIVARGRRQAQARILESRLIADLPRPHIFLNLALSRFPVMDAIIEKAVEMGVHTLQPFFSEYSFLRKEDALSENKLERWGKIIVSATQQCGRGGLMKLPPPVPLSQVLEDYALDPAGFGVFSYEGPGTGLKEALKRMPNALDRDRQHIHLFIGSEGGFSLKEVEQFKGHHLHPISLGSQVLRVETACIALVSAIKYEFDLMG